MLPKNRIVLTAFFILTCFVMTYAQPSWSIKKGEKTDKIGWKKYKIGDKHKEFKGRICFISKDGTNGLVTIILGSQNYDNAFDTVRDWGDTVEDWTLPS